MTPEQFKNHVERFMSKSLNQFQLKSNMWFGWRCETGELGDIFKKHFWHGDPLDKQKVILETGDVLFYMFGAFIVERQYEIAMLDESYVTFTAGVKEAELEDLFDELDVIYHKLKLVMRSSSMMPNEAQPIVHHLTIDYFARLQYLIYPITLEECMIANEKKLVARHGGSGCNFEHVRRQKDRQYWERKLQIVNLGLPVEERSPSSFVKDKSFIPLQTIIEEVEMMQEKCKDRRMKKEEDFRKNNRHQIMD